MVHFSSQTFQKKWAEILFDDCHLKMKKFNDIPYLFETLAAFYLNQWSCSFPQNDYQAFFE